MKTQAFANVGGVIGIGASFAFPRVGVIDAFIIGAVCGGGGAALGSAVGGFVGALQERPDASIAAIDKTGAAVAGFVLGIISMIGWLIPIIGLPLAIAGYLFGRAAVCSSQRGLALTAMGFSLVALLLACLNGYVGALLAVHAVMASHQ
jgi:hypothetical protein